MCYEQCEPTGFKEFRVASSSWPFLYGRITRYRYDLRVWTLTLRLPYIQKQRFFRAPARALTGSEIRMLFDGGETKERKEEKKETFELGNFVFWAPLTIVTRVYKSTVEEGLHFETLFIYMFSSLHACFHFEKPSGRWMKCGTLFFLALIIFFLFAAFFFFLHLENFALTEPLLESLKRERLFRLQIDESCILHCGFLFLALVAHALSKFSFFFSFNEFVFSTHIIYYLRRTLWFLFYRILFDVLSLSACLIHIRGTSLAAEATRLSPKSVGGGPVLALSSNSRRHDRSHTCFFENVKSISTKMYIGTYVSICVCVRVSVSARVCVCDSQRGDWP